MSKQLNKPILLGGVAVLAVAAVALLSKGTSPEGYAKESLKAVSANWDYNQFTNYADESLERVVTAEKWQEYVTYYSQLGALTSIGECSTQTKETLAKVECPASFENAEAKYSVEMAQEEGGWELTSMYVISDLFKKKASEPAKTEEAAPEESAEEAAE